MMKQAKLALGIAVVLACVWVQAAWGQVNPADATAARARFRAGQEAFRGGQLADAEKAFLDSIRLDPSLVAARCALGQTYMALKQYGGAVEALTLCKSETLRQADRSQADAAKRDQQIDQEIQELRDTLREIESGQLKFAGTDKATGINKRIEELQMQKRTVGGKASLPPEIPFALGTALLRVGSLDAAERELLEAIKARPDYGEAHNNLAAVYVGKSEWKEAGEQVALAEKAGFRVPPQLVADIRDQRSSMKVVPPAPSEVKLPAPAVVTGPLRIEHEAVGCVLADAFPELEARIESGEGPKASLRFRAQGESRWYGVPMYAREDVYKGVLPRPKASAKGIEYQIVATDRSAGKAETPVFRAPVVESADACAGKRISALAVAPPQIDVQVPEGTRSLPPGFSEKNVVGNYESGKPVKGHPRTALFAALGAGALAGGLSTIAGHGAPGAATPKISYISLQAAFPRSGSTVSIKDPSIQLVFSVDIGTNVPADATMDIELHASAADSGCVVMRKALSAPIPSFTPTLITATPPYASVNRACGATFDVTYAHVRISGPGGVYAETGNPPYFDVPIRYTYTP